MSKVKPKNAPHPDQPIIKDDDGVHRFKANQIIRYLVDRIPHVLNDLHTKSPKFSTEDHAQFNQLIGYSVCGYGELSFIPTKIYDRATKDYHSDTDDLEVLQARCRILVKELDATRDQILDILEKKA